MAWQDILIRLAVSVAVGFIIGMEREHNRRPAGIKTHILVCVGATLVSLIQINMVNDTIRQIQMDLALASALKIDLGRLGAQVISGIGFLGAGTIIRNKGSVKGLTTAATLWIVACLGLGIGMGYYIMCGIAVAIIMGMLILLRLLQNVIQNRVGERIIEIHLKDKKKTLSMLKEYFVSKMIKIEQIEFLDSFPEKKFSLEYSEVGAAIPMEEQEEKPIYVCQFTLLLPRFLDTLSIMTDLSGEQNICSIRESDKHLA